MSTEQKGFIVYKDLHAVVDELTDEQAGQLFKGMIAYSADGTEPKFDGVLKFVFIPIKQQMDRDSDKYDAKCEKMRANANKRWQNNANVSKGNQLDANNANTNTDTDTDKDTKTETDTNTNTESAREADAALSLSERIISYLNEKTGSQYRPTTATAKIQGLLDQGYTEADMRMVIDKKCADWLDDDNMREHLRPSTLFRADKFEEYLNAPVSLKLEKKQKQTHTKLSLEKQLQEKTEALATIRDSIESMKDEDGRVRENITEYRALKEQAAILEDTIGQIENWLRIN